MAEFSAKVAVVAGGALGIGRAAARKLGAEGASVVICSDREEQVEDATAELREEGLEIRGVRADVTSSADMKGLMDFAAETYGGVDVLVNSAGVQRYGTVVETVEETVREWGRMHPVGRVARPEEVAEVIAFLAGPGASFVTGGEYKVDGGMLAALGVRLPE